MGFREMPMAFPFFYFQVFAAQSGGRGIKKSGALRGRGIKKSGALWAPDFYRVGE